MGRYTNLLPFTFSLLLYAFVTRYDCLIYTRCSQYCTASICWQIAKSILGVDGCPVSYSSGSRWVLRVGSRSGLLTMAINAWLSNAITACYGCSARGVCIIALSYSCNELMTVDASPWILIILPINPHFKNLQLRRRSRSIVKLFMRFECLPSVA